MLKPGMKIRALYEHSETAVIMRKSKSRREFDIGYFGSEEKADQWYLIRWDSDGRKACCHRDMFAVSNC